MNLLDAILAHEGNSKRATICAREPFHQSSEAVIIVLDDGGRIPEDVKAAGYAYFLENSLVAELAEMMSSKVASPETLVEFVIHYGTWDAYPSFYNDLRDKG